MFNFLRKTQSNTNSIVEDKKDYSSCFPKDNDVLDAAGIGCATGALTGAVGGIVGATAGCISGASIGAATQMVSDARKAEQCMAEQDKKEALDVPAPAPAPITPAFDWGKHAGQFGIYTDQYGNPTSAFGSYNGGGSNGCDRGVSQSASPSICGKDSGSCWEPSRP